MSIYFAINNGQLYTGYTSDLKCRVKEHKAGKSKFTSQRLPVELIHYEAYMLESDARRREHYLKTSDGKFFLHQQIRDLLISRRHSGVRRRFQFLREA